VPPLNCVNFGSLKKTKKILSARVDRCGSFFPVQFAFIDGCSGCSVTTIFVISQSERRIKWVSSWKNEQEEKVNRGRSASAFVFLSDFHRVEKEAH